MSSVALGLALIVVSALVEALAQIAWKISSYKADRKGLWVLLGGIAYAIEIPLYTYALTIIDVTIAFALGSVTFVAVALLSRILLKERISVIRAMGLLLILCGVAFMGAEA